MTTARLIEKLERARRRRLRGIGRRRADQFKGNISVQRFTARKLARSRAMSPFAFGHAGRSVFNFASHNPRDKLTVSGASLAKRGKYHEVSLLTRAIHA